MTRRDYVALSAAIRAELAGWHPEASAHIAMLGIAVRIADECAKSPSFNRARFLEDCGFDSPVDKPSHPARVEWAWRLVEVPVASE